MITMQDRPSLVAMPEPMDALAHLLGLDHALQAGALPDRNPGAFRSVIFDLRSDIDDAIAMQLAWRSAGTTLFFVGVAPGLVQFGPVVRPDRAGCLSCWDQRNFNNQRGPRPDGAFRDPIGFKPLTPAAVAMVRPLTTRYAAAVEHGDEALLDCYVRVRTDDLAVDRHRFQPVTGCRSCPPRQAKPQNGRLVLASRIKKHATDKRAPNPRLTLRKLRDAFVDRHSGLIKHVFQDASSTLMPLCSAEMQLFGDDGMEAGYGRSESGRSSELVAILEAVERQAGHQPHAGQPSIRGSFRTLADDGQPVVDPGSFILHGEEQYRDPNFQLLRYDENLEIEWCPAHSMRHDRGALVPEQLVYYRLRNRPGRPVSRFAFDSSNGCSLGGSIEEAMLGGLYEVVERDAYFCTWYTRITPPRIRTDSVLDPRAAGLIARAVAEGFEIHLFDITTDVAIPSVWAMIVDPSPEGVVKSYCASGCHGRWDEAVFAALVEVTTSMGVYQRSMAAQRDDALVVGMADHVLLYSLADSYPRLNFLHGGPEVTLAECEAKLPSLAVRDVLEELHIQTDRVLSVADDVLAVDQTFDAMRPLGLSCVKVMAPGLLPVTFGHQYRRIGLDRLNAFARFRGNADAAFTAATINPYPHNFP